MSRFDGMPRGAFNLPPGVSLRDLGPRPDRRCLDCGGELTDLGHCQWCEWEERMKADREERDDTD